MIAAQKQFFFSSLLALMEDENVDTILSLVPVVLSSERLSAFLGLNDKEVKTFQEIQKENISMVKERAKEYGNPVFIISLVKDEEAFSFLLRGEIPAYHSPQRTAMVLRHLACGIVTTLIPTSPRAVYTSITDETIGVVQTN